MFQIVHTVIPFIGGLSARSVNYVVQPVSKMWVRIEWSGPSLFEAAWPEKHVANFSLSAAEREFTT